MWRFAWIMMLSVLTGAAIGAEPEGTATPPLNLPSFTFGGMQFWSDLRVYDDWRIQRNAMSGHCRLLDSENVRHSWGSLQECEQAFAKLKGQGGAKKAATRVIVTLHGLGSTRRSMEPIGKYLAGNSEFAVVNVSYASTRGDLDRKSTRLNSSHT